MNEKENLPTTSEYFESDAVSKSSAVTSHLGKKLVDKKIIS